MSYVLSVIQPPEGEAQYGKALVLNPVSGLKGVMRRIVYILNVEADIALGDAEPFGAALISKDLGTFERHSESGLAFRVDPAENVPHPCPCDGCGRLVLPTDHAYADAEDAYCLGCFTWSRNVPSCLPENTAHTAGREG